MLLSNVENEIAEIIFNLTLFKREHQELRENIMIGSVN